jgi:hypothetical protein
LSLVFSSTIFDILKIRSKKIAQKPQTTPIKATELFPSNGLSKLTFEKLKMIRIWSLLLLLNILFIFF